MEQRVEASNRSVAVPNRRNLRWRIGIAIWALSMAAFLFLGFRWNHLQFRRAALDYLQARGASIEFADEPSFFWQPLRPLVGDDAFRRVQCIDLSSMNADDTDLAQIATLEEVESLDLRYASISDRGAALLASLDNLQAINLAGSSIGTAGVAKLPDSKLTVIDLSQTQITDGAIEIIAGWRGLESVTLRSIRASDTGLAELGRLPKLQRLDLSKSPAGTETLRALSGHPSLQHLVLEGCPIADGDLESVANCPKMEMLSVASTKIGDVGISRLAACKTLKKLVMRSTRATERVLWALRPLLELNEIEAENTEVSRAALEQFRRRHEKQRKSLPRGELESGSPYEWR